MPWPRCLATPCLSVGLAPVHTRASRARRGAEGRRAPRGWGSPPPKAAPDPRVCVWGPWGHGLPAAAARSRSHTGCALCLGDPPRPLAAGSGVCLWFRGGRVDGNQAPHPRQRRKGRGTGGVPEGRACWEGESWQGWGGQVQRGSARGSCAPARGPRLPAALGGLGAPPPVATIQEAAAWAAVSALGGGRVVAGRGLDQECVSRNVAALGWGAGAGRAGGVECLPGTTQWLLPPLGLAWRGLRCVPACGYPFLPKAPTRGGSPWAMRSPLSVAAQSPGQGIQGGGSGVGTTSVENVKVQLRRL